MALIDDIRAKVPKAVLALKDTYAIAAELSKGRTVIVPRPIGNGTVLETLGDKRGALVLSNLQKMASGDPRCMVAVKMLDSATFDVGSATTRQTIDELSVTRVDLIGGTLLTPAEAALLKGLAVQPNPYDEFEVRCACKAVDGTWIP